MHHTLLLNAGYEPLRIVPWQRAFILVFQEKVEILEEYQHSVRTVSQRFNIPAVIRLRRWINLRRSPPIIRFSRVNVYLRDNYQCQYCLHLFSERELTLDHVVPVVHGGKKNWENIVTACIRCNQRKGDRPSEAVGMSLIRRPFVPRWLPGMVSSIRTKSAPSIWSPYLKTHTAKK